MVEMDFKRFFLLAITIVALSPSFISSLFMATNVSAVKTKDTGNEQTTPRDANNGNIEDKKYWSQYLDNLGIKTLREYEKGNNTQSQVGQSKVKSAAIDQQKKFILIQQRRQRTRALKRRKLARRRQQIWHLRQRGRRSIEETGYLEKDDGADEIRSHHGAEVDEQAEELRYKESSLMWYYWWYKTFINVNRSINGTTEIPRTMMPLSKMIFHDRKKPTTPKMTTKQH